MNTWKVVFKNDCLFQKCSAIFDFLTSRPKTAQHWVFEKYWVILNYKLLDRPEIWEFRRLSFSKDLLEKIQTDVSTSRELLIISIEKHYTAMSNPLKCKRPRPKFHEAKKLSPNEAAFLCNYKILHGNKLVLWSTSKHPCFHFFSF